MCTYTHINPHLMLPLFVLTEAFVQPYSEWEWGTDPAEKWSFRFFSLNNFFTWTQYPCTLTCSLVFHCSPYILL